MGLLNKNKILTNVLMWVAKKFIPEKEIEKVEKVACEIEKAYTEIKTGQEVPEIEKLENKYDIDLPDEELAPILINIVEGVKNGESVSDLKMYILKESTIKILKDAGYKVIKAGVNIALEIIVYKLFHIKG